MSSTKEKLEDFFFSSKGLFVLNVLGLGAFGYFIYKTTNGKNTIRLSEEDRERLNAINEIPIDFNQEAKVYAKNRKSINSRQRLSQLIARDRTETPVQQLSIPQSFRTNSSLVEELRYMESEFYPMERVPHLAYDLQVKSYKPIPSPLQKTENGNFVDKEEFVVSGANFQTQEAFNDLKKYVRAGPKEELFFEPSKVKALIVTCGGLCPGLNSVIREIVMSLHYNYGVTQIYGSNYGYQGIYNPSKWIELTPKVVKNVHTRGGTFIGTSRGGFDLEKILNAVVDNGVNQLYIIGGDGTHAGIYEIYREVKKRQLKISVAGIPKTIDNDIPIIDCSFGYQTALEEAQRAIQTAWVESHSHEYGIGLVKLMGRQAGWIAMGASYAARNVNICLIPESQFDLYGEKGLLEYIYQRLMKDKKVVIVVAEGAIDGCRDLKMEHKGTDKSGNPILPDVAVQVKKEINKYCSDKGISVTLKYIDPSYMVRSCPPNAQDQKICSFVAQNAVHGSMFGFTGFSNGLVAGKNCLISLEELLAKDQVKNVPKNYRQWRRFLTSSGQPDFLN